MIVLRIIKKLFRTTLSIPSNPWTTEKVNQANFDSFDMKGKC